VALSISASRRWKTKNWTIPYMAELSDMLAKEKSIRVVLVGSGEDSHEADQVMKRSGAKPINAVGKTSISQLIGLIGRCNALVTGDSSPMHVAASVGTPFVALFGPTDPRKHISPARDYRVLYKEMACSPCYRPVCLKSRRCISSITPKEVYGAVMEVIR